jgi:hypothetical protein
VVNDLLKTQVYNLAKYYGLKVDTKMLKGELIDAILEYQKQPEAEEPPMSVRVQRLKELNRS